MYPKEDLNTTIYGGGHIINNTNGPGSGTISEIMGLQFKHGNLCSLTLWNSVRASVMANYYWIHTYVGLPGNNFVGILKPKLTVEIFKDISLALEHIIYYDDRYPRGDDQRSILHFVRTEQKAFL